MKQIDYLKLTPVEKHGDYWFKRDDLFKPFADFGITGGKLRQCLKLVETNLDDIKDNWDSTIATVASVHSPQTAIVSRVAKHFGLKSIIGVGSKEIQKHKSLRMCQELGSEVITLSTTWAYDGILQTRLNKLAETRPMYAIKFGYKAETDPGAILGMNAYQVKNMPDEITKLVIPIGSGVSSAGVLKGVEEYRSDLLKKNAVILIQPFGHNRVKNISSILVPHIPLLTIREGRGYKYYTGKYDYTTPVIIEPSPGFILDHIYEAKSWDYFLKNKKELGINKSDKVCYWCVGNANVLREP